MKRFLTTNEVADLLGLKPHTLRSWARAGLVGEVGRSLGGARWMWSPKQVEQLERAIAEGRDVETEDEVLVGAE